MRIEAPYIARESRSDGVRAFGISKTGNAMEIISVGAVHELTNGTAEIRIAWENQNIKFEQPPEKIAEIVRTSDSKHALEEMLRLGATLVDPNKIGQRWPSSVLRSFQEGVKSGYLVLENAAQRESEGKGKV